MFHRFSDETSFFVATMNQRPVGLETSFSIQLADHRPVLQGTCVVLAAWQTPDNPFKRPGVRLGIRRLTPDSQSVFEQLQQARANLEPTNQVSIDTGLEPFSEAPVAIPLPSQAIGTGSMMKIPRVATNTNNVVAIPRTATSQRRAGSVVAPAMIPPKTPPEANVLELILPIVADSPSEAIALPIEVEPAPEPLRTPGSDYILPANPLMNLTDDSLKGFIDCTLYEDHANFPIEHEAPQIIPAIPLMAGDEQVLVGRTDTNQLLVARTGNTIPPPLGRRSTTIPPMLRLDQNVLREEPSHVGSMPLPVMRMRSGNTVPPSIRLEPSGLMRVDGENEPLRIETQSGHSGQLRLEASGLLRVDDDSGQGQSGLLRVDGASGMLRIEPMASPPPLPPAFPMHSQPIPPPFQQRFASDTAPPLGEAFLATETRREPWLNRRVIVIGAAALGSLLLIAIIAIASRGGGGTGEPESRLVVAAPPAAIAPAAPPTPKPPPVATVAAVEPSKEPEPDPSTEGPVVVGDGPCKLEVTTSPAGTMVALDGRPIGASPLTVAGTCASHRVEVAHPRYKAESRLIALAEGKPATLDITLVRPTHNLKILTSPPGAEVFIGGRRAGTSPTMVQINGFSGIDVRVERVGFKPMSKRVYSKAPDDVLKFGLDPLPRPK